MILRSRHSLMLVINVYLSACMKLFQVIHGLIYLRVMRLDFYNNKLSFSSHRRLAEGKATREGRFRNPQSYKVVIALMLEYDLTWYDIIKLKIAMPESQQSTPTLFRYAFVIMCFAALFSFTINLPSCIYGKLRAILYGCWEKSYQLLQKQRRNVITCAVADDNKIRLFFQGSIGKVIEGGTLFIKGFEKKEEQIHFGPMWVSFSKNGTLKMYDIEYNKVIGEGIVLNKCSLRDDLIELLKKQY